MKKAIWGYNIHEVDESIDYLETQNIKLEKQVRQLSEDLEKVRGELRLYEESANGADGADGENDPRGGAAAPAVQPADRVFVGHGKAGEVS